MAEISHKDDVVATETEELVSTFSDHAGDKVDFVTVSIKAMLQESEKHASSTKSCCIYKIPHILYELHRDAYIPKIVSIGPVHHGNPQLKSMEIDKQIYFKEFVEEAHTSLDDLISFAKISAPKVCACYSGDFYLDKKELMPLILLVDAGFIIKLFRRVFDGLLFNHEVITLKPCLMPYLVRDLLLLENQLPYFFLEEIFSRAYPPDVSPHLPSFRELTFNFFESYNLQNLEPISDIPIKHFTDLLRHFYLPENKPQKMPIQMGETPVLFYSAKELHETGVNFTASNASRRPTACTDLKFLGGVLDIPQIIVDQGTESLFLNMIALEQCHYPCEAYIQDYVYILDCLINTSEDVDVLVHNGIICNYLPNSENVAQLFNGLGKDAFLVNFRSDYHDICQSLNCFYRDPWNRMKATLISDYGGIRIGGVFVIILDIIQAIFSIIN